MGTHQRAPSSILRELMHCAVEMNNLWILLAFLLATIPKIEADQRSNHTPTIPQLASVCSERLHEAKLEYLVPLSAYV